MTDRTGERTAGTDTVRRGLIVVFPGDPGCSTPAADPARRLHREIDSALGRPEPSVGDGVPGTSRTHKVRRQRHGGRPACPGRSGRGFRAMTRSALTACNRAWWLRSFPGRRAPRRSAPSHVEAVTPRTKVQRHGREARWHRRRTEPSGGPGPKPTSGIRRRSMRPGRPSGPPKPCLTPLDVCRRKCPPSPHAWPPRPAAALEVARHPEAVLGRARRLSLAVPMLRQAVRPILTGRVDDWRAEYAYTAGVQAFIYGFPVHLQRQDPARLGH